MWPGCAGPPTVVPRQEPGTVVPHSRSCAGGRPGNRHPYRDLRSKEKHMPKNIVFCADGTWNNPNEDENADHSPDPTNVYKLFICLDGALAADSLLAADEQEKAVVEAGITQQI